MTISDLKNSLDVCDKMIDTLYRRLISTENLLGGISSAYAAMSEDEKEEYEKTRKQHHELCKYRLALMQQALEDLPAAGSTSLVVIDGFNF